MNVLNLIFTQSQPCFNALSLIAHMQIMLFMTNGVDVHLVKAKNTFTCFVSISKTDFFV